MTRSEQIKERLARWTDPDKTTDEHLEDGDIADWITHSDGDIAYLLQRATDLRARLEVYRKGYLEADFERFSRQLQLNKAMSCLFKILEGKDRDAAIEEARTWLKKFWKRKGGYDLRAKLEVEIIPAVMEEIIKERNGFVTETTAPSAQPDAAQS
jgi:hypothetical protein